MTRDGIALGLTAVVAVVIAAAFIGLRVPAPSDPAPAVATPRLAREVAPTPVRGDSAPVPPAIPSAPRAPAKGAGAAPPRDATRVQTDLRALEDQALRQIDVVPLLRAAGVDPAALEARSDGNDQLRHIAADELITRSIMRDILNGTIYPYGYPRAQALADARSMADRMMAAMTPEARIDQLERALVDGSSAEPEPSFYGPDSGRVFAEGDRGESPSN